MVSKYVPYDALILQKYYKSAMLKHFAKITSISNYLLISQSQWIYNYIIILYIPVYVYMCMHLCMY